MSTDKMPKYYSLYLTEDRDFLVAYHQTRREAEEHVLEIAQKDGFESTTFSELEEEAFNMYVGGDTSVRVEVGIFTNFSNPKGV